MARIRTVKAEFWVSEQIAGCSIGARLTFIGLWNFCDDNGVHPAKPKTLKAELYPMDAVSPDEVAKWIDELIAAGLVATFDSEGDSYWFVTGWKKHQKIDRPSAKHPLPPPVYSPNARQALTEGTASDGRALDDDSSNARRAPPPGLEGSGKEGSGKEANSPQSRRRTPATTMPEDFGISDRVRTWAQKQGFDRLEEHFEYFRLKAKAKAYTNADWDAAFMGAIRSDWAKVRSGGSANAGTGSAGGLDRDATPPWLAGTGFPNVFAAESAGCGPGNAVKYRNGAKVAA